MKYFRHILITNIQRKYYAITITKIIAQYLNINFVLQYFSSFFILNIVQTIGNYKNKKYYLCKIIFKILYIKCIYVWTFLSGISKVDYKKIKFLSKSSFFNLFEIKNFKKPDALKLTNNSLKTLSLDSTTVEQTNRKPLASRLEQTLFFISMHFFHLYYFSYIWPEPNLWGPTENSKAIFSFTP